MRPTTLLLLATPLLGACKDDPPLVEPELEDTTTALFAAFEADPGDEHYARRVADLQFLLGEMDLAPDARDRALTFPILMGDDLGDLEIPAGADPADQIPVGLSGRSDHPVDAHRVLHVDPNQTCIESESTTWAGRTALTDPDCWADGSCDRLETVTEVRKENILAKVWYDVNKTYRTVPFVDADGAEHEAIVARAWTDKVYEADGGGGNSWDQLFTLDVSLPDPSAPGKTLRWTVMWSSITLVGLGDDGYQNLVIEGIDQGYGFADDYLDGRPGENCKHDRSDPRPSR